MTDEERKAFIKGVSASFVAGLLIWFLQSQLSKSRIEREE